MQGVDDVFHGSGSRLPGSAASAPAMLDLGVLLGALATLVEQVSPPANAGPDAVSQVSWHAADVGALTSDAVRQRAVQSLLLSLIPERVDAAAWTSWLAGGSGDDVPELDAPGYITKRLSEFAKRSVERLQVDAKKLARQRQKIREAEAEIARIEAEQRRENAHARALVLTALVRRLEATVRPVLALGPASAVLVGVADRVDAKKVMDDVAAFAHDREFTRALGFAIAETTAKFRARAEAGETSPAAGMTVADNAEARRVVEQRAREMLGELVAQQDVPDRAGEVPEFISALLAQLGPERVAVHGLLSSGATISDVPAEVPDVDAGLSAECLSDDVPVAEYTGPLVVSLDDLPPRPVLLRRPKRPVKPVVEEPSFDVAGGLYGDAAGGLFGGVPDGSSEGGFVGSHDGDGAFPEPQLGVPDHGSGDQGNGADVWSEGSPDGSDQWILPPGPGEGFGGDDAGLSDAMGGDQQ